MKLVISSVLSTVLLVAAARTAETWQDTPPPIKALFESGLYQDVVDRSQGEPAPEDLYLIAQAYLKQQNGDAAKQTLNRLAERGENDPWALVARSEHARIDQNMDEALSLAQAAVGQAPPPPVSTYAFYQRGLVQSQRQDMAGAAESFENAASIDPTFAYAHYYAGMANSQLQRIDRVASHFETFLKLAPEAPERAAVESIMRTVRGR
ncbi:MAG: tetratricopeptide repeat protein [Vicinamibacterales bacterium]